LAIVSSRFLTAEFHVSTIAERDGHLPKSWPAIAEGCTRPAEKLEGAQGVILAIAVILTGCAAGSSDLGVSMLYHSRPSMSDLMSPRLMPRRERNTTRQIAS
jgi:hypothetical protein